MFGDMNDYLYLPFTGVVIDKDNFVIYSISEFKKMIGGFITEENANQLKWNRVITEAKQDNDFKKAGMRIFFYEGFIEFSEKKIEKFKRALTRCVYIKDTNSGYDLAKAKEVPLSNFVEFDNGNKAQCPFQAKQKTGAMHYYKKDNRFHCFSCGAHGDVIDFVMKDRNVKLPEAVKIILNG